MKAEMNKVSASPTRMLAEGALMVAMATVLSVFAVLKAPNGGSFAIGSMIPVMLFSLKYSFAWSATAAFAYALIQILTGFYAPPVDTLFNYFILILLDYLIAFGSLCLAGPAYRILPRDWRGRTRLIASASLCLLIRFLCHFISGIIIWAVYAPEGQPVWLYSLVYNGSYMLFEAIATVAILFVAGEKLYKLYIDR